MSPFAKGGPVPARDSVSMLRSAHANFDRFERDPLYTGHTKLWLERPAAARLGTDPSVPTDDPPDPDVPKDPGDDSPSGRSTPPLSSRVPDEFFKTEVGKGTDNEEESVEKCSAAEGQDSSPVKEKDAGCVADVVLVLKRRLAEQGAANAALAAANQDSNKPSSITKNNPAQQLTSTEKLVQKRYNESQVLEAETRKLKQHVAAEQQRVATMPNGPQKQLALEALKEHEAEISQKQAGHVRLQKKSEALQAVLATEKLQKETKEAMAQAHALLPGPARDAALAAVAEKEAEMTRNEADAAKLVAAEARRARKAVGDERNRIAEMGAGPERDAAIAALQEMESEMCSQEAEARAQQLYLKQKQLVEECLSLSSATCTDLERNSLIKLASKHKHGLQWTDGQGSPMQRKDAPTLPKQEREHQERMRKNLRTTGTTADVPVDFQELADRMAEVSNRMAERVSLRQEKERLEGLTPRFAAARGKVNTRVQAKMRARALELNRALAAAEKTAQAEAANKKELFTPRTLLEMTQGLAQKAGRHAWNIFEIEVAPPGWDPPPGMLRMVHNNISARNRAAYTGME